ncbi:MAG: 2OG-Fe(II) oxygenase [Myxococcota bacterium]
MSATLNTSYVNHQLGDLGAVYSRRELALTEKDWDFLAKPSEKEFFANRRVGSRLNSYHFEDDPAATARTRDILQKLEPWLSVHVPDAERLALATAQFNKMDRGHSVGRHVDVNSNGSWGLPLVLVFMLEAAKHGGDFVVYQSGSKPISFVMPDRSLLMLKSDVEHSVSMVKQGARASVVMRLERDG